MVTESSLTSVLPAAYGDRFFLVAISGQPEFRPAYDALCRMGFYDFEPDRIRELQSTGPTEILASDGANLSSVFRRLGEFDKERQNRVLEYLTLVVPSISEVTVKAIGKKETLTFRQYGKAPNGRFNFNDLAAYGSCFDAESMSDGTLRALAVLVALFQSPFSSGAVVPLVALEEPETGLHPGASAVLRAALTEAAESTQILATNHSPDLLDDKEIVPGVLIAVKNTDGSSIIGPIDNASRSIIRDGLMTAGELLKQNQLEVVDVR
jgi:predicted ATPase